MLDISFDAQNCFSKSGILSLNESFEHLMFSKDYYDLQNLADFNEGISKIDNERFTAKNENELDQIDKGDSFEMYFNVEKNGTTAISSKKKFIR